MQVFGTTLCLITFVSAVAWLIIENVAGHPMSRSAEKAFLAVAPPAAIAGVLLFLFS